MNNLRVSYIVMGTIATLLLVVGSASATTLTSPTGTVATPTIKAESEGYVVLDGFGFECNWALEGTVESHGAGKPAVVPLSSLVHPSCKESSWKVGPSTPGKFEINWTSGYNGTVTWTGGTIEWILIPGFMYCRFKPIGHFGTITGGSPAIVHIDAPLEKVAGPETCSGYRLTGKLKVTSPSSLYVDS